MRFVAILTDKPGTADLRTQNLPAHHDFLERNRQHIALSGAMRAEAEGPARGGLWVIEADSKEAAQAIVEDDPFFKAGMRGSVEIYHWSSTGKIG